MYSGSVVKQGELDALVYGTGANTFFGKTAKLVETAHTVSHFQRAVLKIGDYRILIAIALVSLILIVALFRGDPMLTTLQFALILTIAAVPVAMPAVLSVTMAVGSRNLAKRQAIVTRLSAMEEMAGIDIICADKTGTLTQNALTLGEPFCMGGIRLGRSHRDGRARLSSRQRRCDRHGGIGWFERRQTGRASTDRAFHAIRSGS